MPTNNPTKPLELSKNILPDIKNMIKQYIYDDANNIRHISDPKKKAIEQARHDAEDSHIDGVNSTRINILTWTNKLGSRDKRTDVGLHVGVRWIHAAY